MGGCKWQMGTRAIAMAIRNTKRPVRCGHACTDAGCMHGGRRGAESECRA